MPKGRVNNLFCSSRHFLSDCIALCCSVVVFILHVVHRDTILCVLSVLGVGVRNITALGNLISWQKVDYDFNYHQMEFPCNINVLIASEGRSLLPVRTSGLRLFSVLLLKYYPHVFGRMYLASSFPTGENDSMNVECLSHGSWFHRAVVKTA